MEDQIIVPTADDLTYERYLRIPEITSLQVPVSEPPEHEETLFIIIHQVYELWFKQILHELTACTRLIEADQLTPCLQSLKRIHTIQRTLTQQVDILETMTPDQFNRFRDNLNPASGFQSFQFRLLEFKMGLRNPGYLNNYNHDQLRRDELKACMETPSFYDLFLRHLFRRGLKIPETVLNRDFREDYEANEELAATFATIYESKEKSYELYLALEALLDMDEQFLHWRFRHVVMVERLIGMKRGTGNSSGVKYLSSTLSKRFFPEVWMARNYL